MFSLKSLNMQYFPQTPIYLQILEWEKQLTLAIQNTVIDQKQFNSSIDLPESFLGLTEPFLKIYQYTYLDFIAGKCTWLRREQLFQKALNAYPYQSSKIKKNYEADHIDFDKEMVFLSFGDMMLSIDFEQILRLRTWGIEISVPTDIQVAFKARLKNIDEDHFDQYLIKTLRQIPKIASQIKGSWQFTGIFDHQAQKQLELSYGFEKLIFDFFDHLIGYQSKWPSLEQDVLESCDLIVERRQPFFKFQVQISLNPTAEQYQKKQESLKRMKVSHLHKRLITPYGLIEEATEKQIQCLKFQSKSKQGQAYELHQRIIQAMTDAHLHPLGAFAKLEATILEMIKRSFA